MVVLNEDGSEWVASEVLEPITEACESAQKNEINLKEKLMKLGLNSEDAVSIEKECRVHEQEKIDRIQKKVELLMCILSIDTAFERLQEIQKAKNEPVWELVFSSGVGAAAFGYLFGGSLWDCLAAFVCGVILQLFFSFLDEKQVKILEMNGIKL